MRLREILSSVRLDRTDVPSQVTIPERQVLKYLAAREVIPQGAVVDLGAGAGSSTLALAEGLSVRGADFPQVHAYDWFSVGPGHFATKNFKAVSPSGDASFLEDFKYFLQPYLPHITVHSGDIKKERWRAGPIGLLHVDICKDLAIFNHIAAEFFPHLAPGSFLIHQDFSRPRLPWLHYSAGIMESILEPLARTGGSVFYRVKQTPSADMVAEQTARNLPIERRRKMARAGIENATMIDNFASEHFACLAEFTDIYIDFWFGDRKVAKERYLTSPMRNLFEKFYPELKSEIAA